MFLFLRIMELAIITGQWERAWSAYTAFQNRPALQSPEYWLIIAEQERVFMDFLQERDVAVEVEALQDRALCNGNAWTVRVMQWMRGEIALKEGDFLAAISHFRDAIVIEPNKVSKSLYPHYIDWL